MATSNPPDWNALLELYGEGASDVEIARALGITIARFQHLCQDQPAFANFAEKGRTLSQAWWVEQARKNLWKKEFNVALWNFNMKNRYGWADKTETVDNSKMENLDSDQLKTQLSAAMKALAKKNPELFSGANLHIVKDAS